MKKEKIDVQHLDIDSRSKDFWNQSYKLSKSINLWGDDYVPYMSKVIDLFNKRGIGKIIDFPCGDGRNLVYLAKSLPFVIGADSSSNALQISDKLIKVREIKNCILTLSDIFNSNFIDNQFEGVFCWDVLGHLKNVEGALSELIRICSRGGVIIGSLFSHGDSTKDSEMDIIGDEEYLYSDKFYFKYYNREDVETLLNKFDVEVDSIELDVWQELPHEGYREYPHEHQSWVFSIIKK